MWGSSSLSTFKNSGSSSSSLLSGTPSTVEVNFFWLQEKKKKTNRQGCGISNANKQQYNDQNVMHTCPAQCLITWPRDIQLGCFGIHPGWGWATFKGHSNAGRVGGNQPKWCWNGKSESAVMCRWWRKIKKCTVICQFLSFIGISHFHFSWKLFSLLALKHATFARTFALCTQTVSVPVFAGSEVAHWWGYKAPRAPSKPRCNTKKTPLTVLQPIVLHSLIGDQTNFDIRFGSALDLPPSWTCGRKRTRAWTWESCRSTADRRPASSGHNAPPPAHWHLVGKSNECIKFLPYTHIIDRHTNIDTHTRMHTYSTYPCMYKQGFKSQLKSSFMPHAFMHTQGCIYE